MSILPVSLLGVDTALLAAVLAVATLLVVLVVWWRRVASGRAAPFMLFPDASFTGSPSWRSGVPLRAADPLDEAPRDEAPQDEAPRDERRREDRRPEPPSEALTAPEKASFGEPRVASSPGLRVLTARGGPAEAERVSAPDAGSLAPALRSEILPALDGTLQLLPGRLVPLNGEGGHEIRFIRVPGANRFTFGRSSGPPHTHIQLRAATASRMHACMAFESGRWSLGNLSATNPVVVNGSSLPLDGALRLQDGDRVEFGELAFTFRVR